MKIALLTFLDVANFGANLQTTSTYNYLKKQGHQVVAINYESYQTYWSKKVRQWKRQLMHQAMPIQDAAHHNYLMQQLDNISPSLHTNKQVANYIKNNHFDGVVIGSDAVAQHWPIGSTWTIKSFKHRPFWFEPLQQERRFPNPFWGTGFADIVPTALLSVSSQNSKYKKFGSRTLGKMARQLKTMKFLSVRDAWTRDMMLHAEPSLHVELTPDPVFAFNQNLESQIPSEHDIRSRFDLPEKYVLIGLKSQVYSVDDLDRLNTLFKQQGKECVAFCIDGVYNYKHNFAYQVPLPISPLDWFALIKYASAYIGSNMHPIVSALTNATPWFSIDNWGMVDFWGNKTKEKKSSKVFDILSQYGIPEYRTEISLGKCDKNVDEIVDALRKFPIVDVQRISADRVLRYNKMMQSIIDSFIATE